MSDLERNKKNVVAFCDMMFNLCAPAAANGFIEYFEKMKREHPGKKVEFRRVIAERDMVVLHCHQTWPDGDDYAGIDIFRLDCVGKIMEHWDVLQTMAKGSDNPNGMF